MLPILVVPPLRNAAGVGVILNEAGVGDILLELLGGERLRLHKGGEGHRLMGFIHNARQRHTYP